MSVCVCVSVRARAYVRSRLYYVSFSAAFAVLLVRSIRRSSVQFSSVQDGIYMLGKAHMRSTPSLRSFPSFSFETVLFTTSASNNPQ